ncbi:hypothetical protein HGRIS_014559 [Hohenbuehelia grisea]|uniref:DUF6535 domain-containing protein n=1 Tax=Hohenbuehelia grisea TaxID=104357 RepID=A0ABR3JTX1_9AGAR
MPSTPPGRNRSPTPSASSSNDHQVAEPLFLPLAPREAEPSSSNKLLRPSHYSSIEETPREHSSAIDPHGGKPSGSSTPVPAQATSARLAAADEGNNGAAAPDQVHSEGQITQSDDDNEQPQAPVPSTSKRRTKPYGQTTFGLKPKRRPANEPGLVDPRDYERKYPEDPIYEELSENARVWRVYLDEAAAFDADLVEKASDGLDHLLIFAGLFSAIVTTFVVQTSQSLSTDHAAVSTSLLLELVSIQRAMADGTSVTSIPPTDTTFRPSRSDIWVNGLWFISLTLSLSTASFTVLVKQWLHQYTAITSGTPRDRSLIRQYRYDGLLKWRVPTIISLLPELLRIALTSFLAGLIIFLAALNSGMAWTVASITFPVYALNSIFNILPHVDPQCPYRNLSFDVIRIRVMDALNDLQSIVACYGPIRTREQSVSLEEVERRKSNTEEVGVRAIEWLVHSTANPPVIRIGLQSLGAFSSDLSQKQHGQSPVQKRTLKAAKAALVRTMESHNHQDHFNARCAERLSRSVMSMHGHESRSDSSSDENEFYRTVPIVVSTFPSSLFMADMRRGHVYFCIALDPPGQQILEIRDLFVHILDSSTNTFLLPPFCWDALSEAELIKRYSPELSTSLADSPDTLLRLYRLAFRSQPLPPKDMAFQPKLISAPQQLLQSLAINAALRLVLSSDSAFWRLDHHHSALLRNEDDHIPAEKNLRALLNISNSLWSSIINPTAPSTEELDPVAGAWSTIASNCHNVDISSGLSQDLAKSAAFILKTRLPHDHRPAACEEVLYGVNAVCSLNGELRSRIYTKLFPDQEFITPGNTDQSLLSSTDGGAWLWAGALEANYPGAYIYFVQLDIPSKLQDSEDTLHAVHQRWPIFKWVLPAFIQGLARRPLSLALNSGLPYLFEPRNLFTACAGVAAASAWSDIVEPIKTLVCLNPEHPSWAERTFYRSKYVDATREYGWNVERVEHVFDLMDKLLQAQKDTQLQSDSEQRPIGEPLVAEHLVAEPQIAEQPQDTEQPQDAEQPTRIAGRRPFMKNPFRPRKKTAGSFPMQSIV